MMITMDNVNMDFFIQFRMMEIAVLLPNCWFTNQAKLAQSQDEKSRYLKKRPYDSKSRRSQLQLAGCLSI